MVTFSLVPYQKATGWNDGLFQSDSTHTVDSSSIAAVFGRGTFFQHRHKRLSCRPLDGKFVLSIHDSVHSNFKVCILPHTSQ